MTPAEHAATAARRPPLPPSTVDHLADEIAELSSHIDAATHRLLTLIRRFDEGSGWATHGALSCSHWLNWRIGLDLGAARERVRVARALGALPLLDATLRRGAISYSKTRAITRVATAANEATLIEMAQHATASQLEKICRGYRRVLTAEQQARPESLVDEEQRRFVRFSDTDDGMVRIDARLRSEEAAVVLQALDVARRRAWRAGVEQSTESSRSSGSIQPPPAGARHDVAADISSETSRRAPLDGGHAAEHRRGHAHEPPPALSRADALVAVAEAFLSTEAATRAARGVGVAPIELVVHVDEAALRAAPRAHAHDASKDDGGDVHAAHATHTEDPTRRHATLDDGTALPLATARRLACDAAVVTITHDAHGNIRTLGRRTRRISATLRRALRVRDAGCRFPGCTNRLTDAHHVVAWAHGGATTLANLCALCRRHHRFVHEHGYRIDTASDGELRFFRRDGSPVPAAGPGVPVATRAAAPRTTATTATAAPTSPSTTFVGDDAAPADTATPAAALDPADVRDPADTAARAATATHAHVPAPADADSLTALRDAHAARGLPAIDARTAFPGWDGTPVDYDLAVQALLGVDARTCGPASDG